jgi:hypothetical protein
VAIHALMIKLFDAPSAAPSAAPHSKHPCCEKDLDKYWYGTHTVIYYLDC